jgi:hypothetical protein
MDGIVADFGLIGSRVFYMLLIVRKLAIGSGMRRCRSWNSFNP